MTDNRSETGAGGWQPPLGASTQCYHGYGLVAALDGIARSGFRGVEISAVVGWTEHLKPGASPSELAALRAALDARGLHLVSMSGHSDLTTPEGASQFRRALDTAAALGIRVVNTGIGGHEGGDEDEAALLRNVGSIADHAAALGIVVALETHGSLLATGQMGADLIRRIGRDDVRLNYDTANVIFYGGVRPERDVVAALPFLASIHLKDKRGGKGVWDFPALGEGEIDFAAILETLRAAGYAGPLSLEIEFQGEPWPALSEVDRAVRASHEHLQKLLRAL